MVNVKTNTCSEKLRTPEKNQRLKLFSKTVGAEASFSFLKPQPCLHDYHPLNAPFESD